MSTRRLAGRSDQEEVTQEVAMMIGDLKRHFDTWTETLHLDLRALAEAIEVASAKIDGLGPRMPQAKSR